MLRILYIDEVYLITKGDRQSIEFTNAIEYVKYLRRVEKYSEAVIFSSFHSANQILEKANTQIITTIGHGFLQLPYTQEQYDAVSKETDPLNDIQLQDIIINFCRIRSAITEGFHIFKGRLREVKGLDIELAEKVKLITEEFTKFEKELIRDVGKYPEIIAEFKRVISLFKADDIDSIDSIDLENEETFSKYLPADEIDKEELIREKKGWKILFLDDKPSELDSILKVLAERCIDYEIATTIQEAKAFIEADKQSNKISVVVSDYRLFEADAKGISKPRMQKEQGYDFLIWLAKQDRYNAMMALSGLSKWFLLESFRKKSIDVKVYSKTGLNAGAAKFFVDDIEYLGSQVEQVVLSQPKATNWRKDTVKQEKITNYALKPYYVFHRNSNEYLTVENSINQQAEKVARELEFAIDKSSDFNFASLVSIQGNATKTMKGEIENEYPDFQLKLLQRRVFYYLLLKGFDKDAISKMLHTGDTQSEMSESMIKQVPSMLAIQTETDIPYGLLVEEKYFLHHYMNLPIYNIAELMDQTYAIINTVLTEHLKNNKAITEKLKNYCVENDTEISFGTVSMTEVHIVLQKVVELMVKDNKHSAALNLIIEIETLVDDIQDFIPSKDKLKKSIKAISALKEKIAKKV